MKSKRNSSGRRAYLPFLGLLTALFLVGLLGLVGLVVLVGAPTPALAQQLGQGMQRTGTVGIQNEAERGLFSSLICTCGCPRESLATCTCDFAHARRAELRSELKAGKPLEEIRDAYVARFGPQALAVPKTKAPIVLPVLAAASGLGLVVLLFRRWRRKGAGEAAPPKGKKEGDKGRGGAGERDAYDEKLDRELRALDDD